MSNLSDKEIDRLSREAADSYEPDHHSMSWSRLEQKLSVQMPERPPDGFSFGRINPYVWGPAVVLIAGVSFFLIKNIVYSQHSTRTNQQANQTVSSAAAGEKQAVGNMIHLDSMSTSGGEVAKEKKNNLPDELNPPASSATDIKALSSKQRMPAGHLGESIAVSATETGKTSKGAGENAAMVSKSVDVNNKAANNSAGKKVMITGSLAAGSLPSNDVSGVAGNKFTGNSNPPQSTPGSGAINGIQPATESGDLMEIQRNRSDFVLPLVISSGADLGKTTLNDSLLNKIAQPGAAPYKSVHINRSLNFGFAFGPDYTDAGGITNDQLGNNIGITVGYYLTSKLSINTGIFYSNKFYWSPGHGTPNQMASYYPVGTVTGNIRTNAAPPAIEYVNGACNMYELPLTLRYDFAHNEKTKFFINGGLSSYFMVKQTYINFFHSASRPVAFKTVDDEQMNYWFDVADLSFGLETEIGKGFSFQAEPFFRLPLKEMGMQNLKMNSYGFMLSFRYTPVLSRSKK
jgi:hypothetical protein